MDHTTTPEFPRPRSIAPIPTPLRPLRPLRQLCHLRRLPARPFHSPQFLPPGCLALRPYSRRESSRPPACATHPCPQSASCNVQSPDPNCSPAPAQSHPSTTNKVCHPESACPAAANSSASAAPRFPPYTAAADCATLAFLGPPGGCSK